MVTPLGLDDPILAGRGRTLAVLDGELVDVDHPLARTPGLQCSACGGPVTLRSTARAATFVHREPGAGAACRAAHRWRTPQSLETNWHLGAKALVLQADSLMTPEMWQGDRLLCGPRRLYFDRLAPEQRVGTLRLDVLAWLGSQSLGIEITVTHGLDERKLRRAQALNLPLLEIDLRDVRSQPWDDLLARAIILEGLHHKRWHLPR